MIARHHVVALDANSNCESATWNFLGGIALWHVVEKSHLFDV